MRRLLQHLALMLNHVQGERQVISFVADLLLAFAAEDVCEELANLRLHGLARSLVDVNRNVTEERVCPVDYVFASWRNVRQASPRGNGDRANLRHQVTNT